MNPNPKETAERVEQILSALPATAAEIHRKTGISQSALSRWLERLNAEKKIHWKRMKRAPNGGVPLRIWERGPKPDGERRRKPPKLYASNAERMRAYRERLIASGEWEEVLAKRRARTAAARTIRRGASADPLMNALFGGKK